MGFLAFCFWKNCLLVYIIVENNVLHKDIFIEVYDVLSLYPVSCYLLLPASSLQLLLPLLNSSCLLSCLFF